MQAVCLDALLGMLGALRTSGPPFKASHGAATHASWATVCGRPDMQAQQERNPAVDWWCLILVMLQGCGVTHLVSEALTLLLALLEHVITRASLCCYC
jgi:hypothetical protein